MDDETLRALIRGIVVEEIERALARRTRCSPAEIEQRRAAAQVSVASRQKKAAALQKRRAAAEAKAPTARSTETATESDTSKRPVQRRGNGGAEELSTAPAIHPTTQVWLRYSTAFKLRYGAFPPRNARANGLLTTLLKLIPAGDAPDTAEFYVRTDDPLYVRANHPLQLLVRDAEKLSVMAATGRTKAEAAAPRPWWQSWPGIEAQGAELGVPPNDNPTLYRNAVLRAAAAWGSLPVEAQVELGMRPPEG